MYDRGYKLEAVKMLLEKGQGVRETARLLGISRATLAGWIRELRGALRRLRLFRQRSQTQYGRRGRQVKEQEYDLEEENEILKKAAAHLRQRPEERYKVIYDLRSDYRVEKMCSEY